jgi:D-amino-acid dehydrogenase
MTKTSPSSPQSPRSTDVIVLGAGVVGTCLALHLQKRGFSTLLIDRAEAGTATSFGNAGLIQQEGIYPYAFPQNLLTLFRYATHQSLDAHYHARDLLRLMPFLMRYWWHSRPHHHAAIAAQYAPLIQSSVSEHLALAAEAEALPLIRERGWLKLFRTPQERDKHFQEAEQLKNAFNVRSRALNAHDLRILEPDLTPELVGALHWTEPASVLNPQALTQAYLSLFQKLGGEFMQADLQNRPEQRVGHHGSAKWRSETHHKRLYQARHLVVALGPWSADFVAQWGYKYCMAVKRGYHRHYQWGETAQKQRAGLTHTVLDYERSYLLAPMFSERGESCVRLTTGAEFARRDAPQTPVQLIGAEPIARTLIPLGAPLDEKPWMGSRPCTPDMLPIMGAAPNHKNLWFSFGHAHHGLTLAAASGRLMTDLIAGTEPFTSPVPYSPARKSVI